jgi:Mycoplasma protein of unknown function, DUF285
LRKAKKKKKMLSEDNSTQTLSRRSRVAYYIVGVAAVIAFIVFIFIVARNTCSSSSSYLLGSCRRRRRRYCDDSTGPFCITVAQSTENVRPFSFVSESCDLVFANVDDPAKRVVAKQTQDPVPQGFDAETTTGGCLYEFPDAGTYCQVEGVENFVITKINSTTVGGGTVPQFDAFSRNPAEKASLRTAMPSLHPISFVVSNIVSVEGGSYTSSTNYKDMSFLFAFSPYLEFVSFSPAFGEHVENMGRMFVDCGRLKTFHTPRGSVFGKVAADMKSMFSYCTSLKYFRADYSLLGSAQTSNMREMFSGCLDLKRIYLGAAGSKFGSEASDMFSMFHSCISLKSFVVPPGTTFGAKAEDMQIMFNYSFRLKQFALSSSVPFGQDAKKLNLMFSACFKLKHVDLPSDTKFGEQAEDMLSMFEHCDSLSKFTLPNAKFGSNCLGFNGMFAHSGLHEFEIKKEHEFGKAVTIVDGLKNMFNTCAYLTEFKIETDALFGKAIVPPATPDNFARATRLDGPSINLLKGRKLLSETYEVYQPPPLWETYEVYQPPPL